MKQYILAMVIGFAFLAMALHSHALPPLLSTDSSEVPFSVELECPNQLAVNYLIVRNPDGSIRHAFKHNDIKDFRIAIYEPGLYTARCIHLSPPSHFGTRIMVSAEKTINARLPVRNIDIPLSGQGTLKLTIRDQNAVPFNYEDDVRFSIEDTFHQNVRYNPISGYQTLMLGTRAQNRITIIKEGYPVTTRDFIIDPETLLAEIDMRLYKTTTPEGGILTVYVFASDGNMPLPTARVSVKYGTEWIAKDVSPGTPIPNLIIQRTYTLIVEADGMQQRITPVLISAKENLRNVHLLSDDFQL
jgi:hypothetical protein